MRFIPITGSARRYLDTATGQTVSRRFYLKLCGIQPERQAALRRMHGGIVPPVQRPGYRSVVVHGVEVARLHKAGRAFFCSRCTRRSTNPDALERHVRRDHAPALVQPKIARSTGHVKGDVTAREALRHV